MDQVIERRLVDGSAPMTSDELLHLLDKEGIDHHTVEHAPMWTVEDAKALRAPSGFGHTKNLFVRNKKGQMWLLTLHEDRKVDLKAVAKLVGTNRFSFASPERLMRYLGVIPGAVSAFSILNDVHRRVEFFIDEALMRDPALHLHPLVNTRTTTIDRIVLLNFLERKGYPQQVLEFSTIDDYG
jgi:Ala-tRNA(Pro) deacylase